MVRWATRCSRQGAEAQEGVLCKREPRCQCLFVFVLEQEAKVASLTSERDLIAAKAVELTEQVW